MSSRIVLAAMLLAALAGCSPSRDLQLPPTAAQPWQASTAVWTLDKHPQGQVNQDFAIPTLPALPLSNTQIGFSDQPLGLAELIDLAQRHNPQTKLAWNQAREAALSIGLTDALFLPSITASVLSGEQRLQVPVKLPLNLGTVDVDNRIRGTTPFVALTWLLFDFGQRNALREGAQYMALGANVLFNASHQKVIRDVTDAYYRYNAARHNVNLAEQALLQHQQVLAAVDARFKQGLATKIDLALAAQGIAQGRLNLVTHQGVERTSYLALTDALGIPAQIELSIAAPAVAQLPKAGTPITQEHLQQALSHRADIAAAYTAIKAAQAGKKSAKAAFLPKVFMAAGWASNQSNLQVGNLGADLQNTASGVVVGVTMPIYDAGLRRTQLHKADIAHTLAEQRLNQLQLTAVREIIGLEQGLNTALQAHDAASELVRTTEVAYQAALAAYNVGRASTVLLTETALQLNKAQQAKADAQYAAIAAAANLAFAMGSMTSAQALQLK